MLLLAGCGQTSAGSGSAKLSVPKSSTEVCNAPDYVRQAVPKGVCGTDFDRLIAEQVEDDMPKYVVSTTLTDPEWNNTSVLRSLDEVAALKEGDGEGTILVHGSPTLAQALAEAGLVDRYHLLQFPVTLGEGKRLFNGREQGTLKLVEFEAYPNGVVKYVYDVER